MEVMEFERLKSEFKYGSSDRKMDIYTKTEGLSIGQYKELLKLLSKEEFERLEKEMN